MIYYVSQKAQGQGLGTREEPFSSINQAAQVARPGDTVLIAPGIYREWVDPKWGGTGENQRITYAPWEKEAPVISGAEVVTGWSRYQGSLWTATVDNRLFGSYNPYADEIAGDWFDGFGRVHHTGEVFLDGEALSEAASLEELTPGCWFASVGKDTTTFYADFRGADPAASCVEVSVRPFCFFPSREGRNYITVSGLTLRQAATQWAPPTAFQPGLIGANWSKGWIIENCTIRDSKCVGISLGKRAEETDNLWSRDHRKGGAQTYTEVIFSNLNNGWSREKVGGHIIRNNEIFNCGQAGIVGNMGCAFSDVIGNHIHHINDRHEFGGAEMGAIKFHCGIDVVVEGNRIHHSTNGLWLDWEAQGAQVRRNAFFENNQDLFIEVCHGPCLVENNLFLSERSFLSASQGIACVHNLFAGEVQVLRDTNRFTMYHIPHSTMAAGVMLIYGGDDKLANNIFCGGQGPWHGTSLYDSYPTSWGDKSMENDTPMADVNNTLPVDIHHNLYVNGTPSCIHEKNPMVLEQPVSIAVTLENGHYYLETNLCAMDFRGEKITTACLGVAFQSGQPYENRDGSPIEVNRDYLGTPRGEAPTAGPFEQPVERLLLV